MILLNQLLEVINPNELVELQLRKVGTITEPLAPSDLKHILTKEGGRAVVRDMYSDVVEGCGKDVTTYTIVVIDNSAEPGLITLV